ncbi:PRC-barrel domain-containing protein [Pyrococcus kukulkanii]|uniref:PRC-barrel domain-containing protein n=1 Tax=Pyrococcus kukulkanii TaxID=1609559 RepID=A0ABV4T5Q7_9EURY
MMRGSKYYGLKVYDLEARYVGQVSDLLLEMERGRVRIKALELKEFRNKGIPYERVYAAGDIVLVK